MDKFTNFSEFVQAVFDDEVVARQAAEIGQAILAERSLRMTDIAGHMEGNSEAAYKRIQRFLKWNDPRLTLIFDTVLLSFTSLIHHPVRTSGKTSSFCPVRIPKNH